MSSTPVSRLNPGSSSFNTLNSPPTVPIHFQRCPDLPDGDTRGIAGIEFQVTIAGAIVQSGTTGADGRVDVRVPVGGTSTLQLMSSGTVAAEYQITVDDGTPDAVTTLTGQQQRLRMLGYHIGHTGPDSNGVEGTLNAATESAILDFQADRGLVTDAVVGPITQGRLTARAGV
jgi:Putative peptidoglycan binding domain